MTNFALIQFPSSVSCCACQERPAVSVLELESGAVAPGYCRECAPAQEDPEAEELGAMEAYNARFAKPAGLEVIEALAPTTEELVAAIERTERYSHLQAARSVLEQTKQELQAVLDDARHYPGGRIIAEELSSIDASLWDLEEALFELL